MIGAPNEPAYYPLQSALNPAWRNTLTHLIVASPFGDNASQATINHVYSDITRRKTEALRQLSPDTGAYFNEGDSYEPEWQGAFWGERYWMLRGVKRRADPKNVLWCRRCVGSEALVETKDGRLCEVNSDGHDEL